jgi:hypothetical protein
MRQDWSGLARCSGSVQCASCARSVCHTVAAAWLLMASACSRLDCALALLFKLLVVYQTRYVPCRVVLRQSTLQPPTSYNLQLLSGCCCINLRANKLHSLLLVATWYLTHGVMAMHIHLLKCCTSFPANPWLLLSANLLQFRRCAIFLLLRRPYGASDTPSSVLWQVHTSLHDCGQCPCCYGLTGNSMMLYSLCCCAGHMVPQTRPVEALDMFSRFINRQPLQPKKQ